MGGNWRRFAVALAGTALVTAGWVPAVSSAASAAAAAAAPTPAPLAIGVDNATPAGHNWEYLDFFPRDNVNVHSGDVVNFAFNPNTPDGFHTATLLPTGTTPAQAWAATPLAVPDTSDPPGSLPLFNPAITAPTFAPPGAPVPGACGDVATPCTFTGGAQLSSGASGPGANFAVKVTAPAGTYDVICLVHPGMHLSFKVVAASTPASTQADLDAASNTQLAADTAEGTAATAAVAATSTVTNANGTHTITMHAGTRTAHVAVDEMLPANVKTHPGDKVTWLGTPDYVHTVTFPQGSGSNSVDPFAGAECETPSGPEPPPTGPPPFGCGPNPANFEQQLNAAPAGPASIRNGGYRTGAADGGVFNFGNATYLGSASQVHPNSPIVGLAGTTDGQGYWQVSAVGGVYTYGDAGFFGSQAGKKISAPIVALLPTDAGYVLVGADSASYGFGNAASATAAGGPLAAPLVGGAINNNGNGGGWGVGADGGVFAVQGATFYGSAGNLHLAKPIVGMAATSDGGGYWLVASDGGIFNYGDAPFLGSLGAMHLNAPIVGMSATGDDQGYELVASDGGVFTFGNARFAGSAGNLHLVSPMNSITNVPGTVASSGILAGGAIPFPTNYTFTFPEAGTFTYQCRIHDHMTGVVTVG